MILSRREIKVEIQAGNIKFDPPIVEKKQLGKAAVDLRLGLKFTKITPTPGVIISLKDGIKALAKTGLWREEVLPLMNGLGKRRTYRLDPGEFVLAQTYEHVWIPRHLIAMVEGRSTYARFGITMHQTAPWCQPGWHGHITLEMRNSGPLTIDLWPLDDMPCQLTFFQLTSEIPEDEAYGTQETEAFQGQTGAFPSSAV